MQLTRGNPEGRWWRSVRRSGAVRSLAEGRNTRRMSCMAALKRSSRAKMIRDGKDVKVTGGVSRTRREEQRGWTRTEATHPCRSPNVHYASSERNLVLALCELRVRFHSEGSPLGCSGQAGPGRLAVAVRVSGWWPLGRWSVSTGCERVAHRIFKSVHVARDN